MKGYFFTYLAGILLENTRFVLTGFENYLALVLTEVAFHLNKNPNLNLFSNEVFINCTHFCRKPTFLQLVLKQSLRIFPLLSCKRVWKLFMLLLLVDMSI